MERQQRAVAVGTEKVIQVWEAMNDGYPFFAVYYNRNNKYFQYNKDDIEGAKAFLSTNLGVLEDADDNSMYYLNIYSEPKVNYQNSGMICSFPFRLNPYGESDSIGGVSGPGMASLVTMVKEAHEKQLSLTKELEEAKAANAPLNVWDRIGGLLETPGVPEAAMPMLTPLVASLAAFVHKVTGTQPVPYMQPGAMPSPTYSPGISGPGEQAIDKDVQLDSILDRLEKHGDLVEMLGTIADFADKSPAMFKTYYNMLKSQQ